VPSGRGGDGERQRRTKKDLIVEELRTLIATGELARGSRLHQDEFARLFNTSITPVREAMRQLEAEGVLVSEPHRGVRVALADLEEVKGVYVARRMLESHAARRASLRVSRRDLTEAAELTDAMEGARQAGDSSAVLEANQRFHFLFHERCGNASLCELIRALWHAFPWDVLQVLEHRVGDSVAEHREIIVAMERGDTDAVGTLMELHLRNGYLALARHMTGSDVEDVFDVDVD
jgi:DNA-binding GntR family transcriptional regulator